MPESVKLMSEKALSDKYMNVTKLSKYQQKGGDMDQSSLEALFTVMMLCLFPSLIEIPPSPPGPWGGCLVYKIQYMT